MSAEHPAPWRWGPGRIGSYIGGKSVDFPGTNVLYDANDERVLWGAGKTGQPSDVWATLETASPRVRELLRAAPEMEALLRKSALAKHGNVVISESWYDEVRGLLGRIDKASKGGT